VAKRYSLAKTLVKAKIIATANSPQSTFAYLAAPLANFQVAIEHLASESFLITVIIICLKYFAWVREDYNQS
jgi:hypothetical protein